MFFAKLHLEFSSSKGEYIGANNGDYTENTWLYLLVREDKVYSFKEYTSSWEGTTTYDGKKVRDGETVIVDGLTFDGKQFAFDQERSCESDGIINISIDDFIKDYCNYVDSL